MLTKIYTGKESVYLYLFYVSTQANITNRLLVSLYMFAASAFRVINFYAFRFNRLVYCPYTSMFDLCILIHYFSQ